MRAFALPVAIATSALLPIAIYLSSTTALAQNPPKLEPLPEISTPPQIPIDPKLEPEVTIKQRGADKVEEFRVNGKLYMVRVTPPGGTPYVLLDQTGGGQLIPSNGQVDARSISVPMWVISTF